MRSSADFTTRWTSPTTSWSFNTIAPTSRSAMCVSASIRRFSVCSRMLCQTQRYSAGVMNPSDSISGGTSILRSTISSITLSISAQLLVNKRTFSMCAIIRSRRFSISMKVSYEFGIYQSTVRLISTRVCGVINAHGEHTKTASAVIVCSLF